MSISLRKDRSCQVSQPCESHAAVLIVSNRDENVTVNGEMNCRDGTLGLNVPAASRAPKGNKRGGLLLDSEYGGRMKTPFAFPAGL
jgi:hypothetical protein